MAFLSIVVALVFTLAIELVVAAFYSRKRRFLVAVILVNLITNPLMNLFLYFNALAGVFSQSLMLILLLEAAVVLAEAGFFVWVRIGSKKKMLLLSFAINACSFAGGILLFGLPFSKIF